MSGHLTVDHCVVLSTEGSVKNAVGEAPPCSCGSWLDHWKHFSGIAATPTCQVHGCSSPATVGAHVHISASPVGGLLSQCKYILPMCINHNNDRGAYLTAKKGARLVLAHPELTCRRSLLGGLFNWPQ